MDTTATAAFIVRDLLRARFTGDTTAPNAQHGRHGRSSQADKDRVLYLRRFSRMLRGSRALDARLNLLAGRCARIGPLRLPCSTEAHYQVTIPHPTAAHPELRLCPECCGRSAWRAGAEVAGE